MEVRFDERRKASQGNRYVTIGPNAEMTASIPTDRKLFLALRAVGPESKAESARFHGRRATKVVPEVKIRPPEDLGAPAEKVREAHLGVAERSGGSSSPLGAPGRGSTRPVTESLPSGVDSPSSTRMFLPVTNVAFWR